MAILLESGDLWRAILRQTARARASGDLQPITTEVHALEDAGVRFAVRVLGGLDRKQRAGARQLDAGVDPFLPPYDDDLFVADVSETHVALLNKWCVVDHHLLVVPRAFEPQESALDVADFEALWACMTEFEALGFYNGGREAGAIVLQGTGPYLVGRKESADVLVDARGVGSVHCRLYGGVVAATGADCESSGVDRSHWPDKHEDEEKECPLSK